MFLLAAEPQHRNHHLPIVPPFVRTYTVEWTGGGNDNRFEIDLYYCGSVCLEVRSLLFGVAT